MFLYNQSTAQYICDFQLIYDTDCKVHFDFYAVGLLAEAWVINERNIMTLSDFGFINCNEKDCKSYKYIIEEKVSSIEFLHTLCEKLNTYINLLIVANNDYEKKGNEKLVLPNDDLLLFNALMKVMAFRRIVDYGLERLEVKYTDRLKEINSQSYLLILQNNLESLDKMSSKVDITTFIRDNGYLFSFDMRENKFENFDYIRQIASEKKQNDLVVKDIIVQYDNTYVNLVDRVLYAFSWYNEMRHVLQLQTLRNIRDSLQHRGIDPYEYSIRRDVIDSIIKELYK